MKAIYYLDIMATYTELIIGIQQISQMIGLFITIKNTLILINFEKGFAER